jgi:glucokinase
MILAGDIGGTNARLAFFEPLNHQNDRFRLVSERIFPSRQFKGLEEIVAQFLAESKVRPEVACFGIAGPVRAGRVETSNLPWIIEQSQLAKKTGCANTTLINDLEATAWGIGGLSEDELTPLHQAAEAEGNQVVVAAGTGLGEAGLFWDGTQHHVFACEGGHTDFAPQGPVENELLQFLAARFGHVSYERILSGPGLVNVYEFLREKKQGANGISPDLTGDNDPAAAISKAALAGSDAVAVQALDLWIAIYGAEAGNLALKVMATGGVFLGGGIAPKILSKLTGPGFVKAFLDKGRMRPLMEKMTVQVITNDKVGLLGAARCGAARSKAPILQEAS